MFGKDKNHFSFKDVPLNISESLSTPADYERSTPERKKIFSSSSKPGGKTSFPRRSFTFTIVGLCFYTNQMTKRKKKRKRRFFFIFLDSQVMSKKQNLTCNK
jgi:hypothetical protein